MSEPSSNKSIFARARPLMLARAASAGFSFIIPLALARLFAQSEYGTYKLLFLVSQTLLLILPFGMSQSLYYFVPRTGARRPFLVQTLLFMSVMGVLAALGVSALGPQIGGWLNNPAFATHSTLLGLYTFGLIASMPLEVALTARGDTNQAAAAYVASDLVKTVAMTVPAALGYGLHGLMAGIAFFALARVVATLLLVLRGEPGPSFDPAALKAQLRYALPFGGAMALAIPQQYFHQYVVSSRLDAATFAVYAVGIFNLPIIDLLYTPTSEMLMIRLAELEREGRKHLGLDAFREAVARLAFIFFPLALFFIAIAPEFITALFTVRYLGSVPVFRVVACGIFLTCLPVDGALRACNETRFIFFSYFIKFAVTVPLVLVGVSRFGMMGGVVSWLAADAIAKGSLVARLPKALGTTFAKLLPWADLGRAAVAATVACGGIFGARLLVGPDHHAAVVVAVAATLYGVAYLLLLELQGIRVPLPFVLQLRRPVKAP